MLKLLECEAWHGLADGQQRGVLDPWDITSHPPKNPGLNENKPDLKPQAKHPNCLGKFGDETAKPGVHDFGTQLAISRSEQRQTPLGKSQNRMAGFHNGHFQSMHYDNVQRIKASTTSKTI